MQYETEYITQRINNGLGYVQQGPRHVQAVLTRLQKRIEETRLQALLEVSFAGLKQDWLPMNFMNRMHGDQSSMLPIFYQSILQSTG